MYVLKYKQDNKKQHSTVNNYISQLDETLKIAEGTETTFFISINDDASLPGSKVLSFDRDGRKSNPQYRQLFDQRGNLLPGVNVWYKGIDDDSDIEEEGNKSGNSSEQENEQPTLTQEPTIAPVVSGDDEGAVPSLIVQSDLLNTLRDENTRLTTDLEAANTTNTALTTELTTVRAEYARLERTARLIEKERDRLQEGLDKELANPSAPGGSYTRLVAAVDFAASACNSTSASQPEWSCNELKRLVTELVQTMVPHTSRAELDRKVHQVRSATHQWCYLQPPLTHDPQINGPLFRLCSHMIEERSVRRCQDGLQQAINSSKKKRKSGGGNAAAASGGGGGGGSGDGGFSYDNFFDSGYP